MVPCGKVLQNKHSMLTSTQGQGQKVKVKGKKVTAIFLVKYLSYIHQIKYNGTMWQDASE